MYKLRYYEGDGRMIVKYFETISEALRYSVYNIPFQSFYGIDKVEK